MSQAPAPDRAHNHGQFPRHAAFNGLTPRQREAVQSRLHLQTVPANQQILGPQGLFPQDTLVLLPLGGAVYCTVPVLDQRSSTTFPGAGSLLNGWLLLHLLDPAAAPATPCVAWSEYPRDVAWLSREDLLSLSKDPAFSDREALMDLARHLYHTWILTVGPAFSGLLSNYLDVFSRDMGLRTVRPGDVLIRPDREPEALMVFGPGVRARVTRTRPGREPVTYDLGLGECVGAQIFSGRLPKVQPDPHDQGATSCYVPPEPTAVGVVVEQGGLVLVHKPRHLEFLRRKHRSAWQWLNRYLKVCATVELASDVAIDGLMTSPLLASFRPGELFPLMQGAQDQLWRVGDPTPAPMGSASGFGAVVEGELVSCRAEVGATSAELNDFGPRIEPMRDILAPGTFGLAEIAAGLQRADHWRARIPSRVIFYLKTRLDDVLGADPRWLASAAAAEAAFQAVEKARIAVAQCSVQSGLGEAVSLLKDHGLLARTSLNLPGAETIYVSDNSATPQTGWDHLLSLLCGELATRYQERSLVVDLIPEGQPTARVATAWGERRRVCTADTFPASVSVLTDLITSVKHHCYSYIFVRVDRSLHRASELRQALHRILVLNTDPRAPAPRENTSGVPLLYTSVLPQRSAEAQGTIYPPGATRLPWTLWQQACAGATTLDDDARQGLARLGRAVSGRRVGIALAGGGIWGMAHVAVLRGLHAAGVPVDLVSGASDGAHVAVWYCTRGLPGLTELLSDKSLHELNRVNLGSLFTLDFLASWINRKLDHATLETLERICIPVGTDILTGSQVPVMTGLVGEGVRRSGSLVPVYPSTPTARRTWLDGAFSANLPLAPLKTEGTDFLIASNCIAPDPGVRARPPVLPGRLGRVAADLNPLRRITTPWYGALTLAYSVGEADASSAAVRFDAAWTNRMFLDVFASQAVAEQMLALPTTREVLHGVKARWIELCQPKVPPAP